MYFCCMLHVLYHVLSCIIMYYHVLRVFKCFSAASLQAVLSCPWDMARSTHLKKLGGGHACQFCEISISKGPSPAYHLSSGGLKLKNTSPISESNGHFAYAPSTKVVLCPILVGGQLMPLELLSIKQGHFCWIIYTLTKSSHNTDSNSVIYNTKFWDDIIRQCGLVVRATACALYGRCSIPAWCNGVFIDFYFLFCTCIESCIIMYCHVLCMYSGVQYMHNTCILCHVLCMYFQAVALAQYMEKYMLQYMLLG
jgi:hypothetical protein